MAAASCLRCSAVICGGSVHVALGSIRCARAYFVKDSMAYRMEPKLISHQYLKLANTRAERTSSSSKVVNPFMSTSRRLNRALRLPVNPSLLQDLDRSPRLSTILPAGSNARLQARTMLWYFAIRSARNRTSVSSPTFLAFARVCRNSSRWPSFRCGLRFRPFCVVLSRKVRLASVRNGSSVRFKPSKRTCASFSSPGFRNRVPTRAL
mmetsp:Transcript_13456/g.29032  ORF Transcript_13456/g.29032 Transcript_13456/m.29032 type:complete len:208 (+) Transcript_13456:1813-2436(+)